ncbi:hypothetical protein GCM10010510_72240 [Streptomyces anandii JCM 4720]|nr:hypothetical protein GCM10010510_72240 [Streptomyces anandii JCM 4720]
MHLDIAVLVELSIARPTSGPLTATVHGWPIEYFDVHDPAIHDVQAQHASRGQERHAPMTGAVWLSLWMSCSLEALAKVIAAAALVNQTKIPRTDG